MDTTLAILFGIALCLLLMAVGALLLNWFRRADRQRPAVQAGLSYMRSIGHLSVFKVITKEIVTELDHSWGDFGKKYLSWVFTERKMAMVFEIEIDFRYDLRSPDFQITARDAGGYDVFMPPCHFDTHIRDIRFYDEQQSKLLPWLLPDLLNTFFSGRFSEEDKNRLVAAAKSHAQEQADQLIDNIRPDFENSARQTLQSIARAFGVTDLDFQFPPQNTGTMDIKVVGRLVA